VGSGTMANDAVAATLAADGQRHNGLVLVNGEFGDRLQKQAARMGLNARVLSWDWGQPWSLDQIEAALREMPRGGWVWGVHHETSTGVLNDLPAIVKLAKEYGHRVCVDCVSSLATVPVDLSGVYLASGASGKAIGSYAGLAFVFADPADLTHIDPDTIPTYLDVPSTLSVVGPRFTVPSPLLLALGAALEPLSTPELLSKRLRGVCELGRYLRGRLRDLGLVPMAADAHANPSIVTFAPPPGEAAAAFVGRCRGYGFQIAGQSGYLAERNLVQIAVMGNVTRDQIDRLLAKLGG
ncbi:MAG TPA: aminotransferase class V-fold PLP-dependent enzyme, partial [Gemmataceae bacterium]|nr:aminotransferase class V-fold PLP-dependent enzyme [Gemmataceae bacterium]